jgi:hypothetical protein
VIYLKMKCWVLDIIKYLDWRCTWVVECNLAYASAWVQPSVLQKKQIIIVSFTIYSMKSFMKITFFEWGCSWGLSECYLSRPQDSFPGQSSVLFRCSASRLGHDGAILLPVHPPIASMLPWSPSQLVTSQVNHFFPPLSHTHVNFGEVSL